MSDSIKVAIKVRPLIKREKDENLPIQWAVQGNSIVSTDPEMKKRGDGGFCFDHIFDMNTSNSHIFGTIVKPIVNAAVNGFNGTVFAYGQTSSGKTYTMMGTMEEPGIIPLAIEHMFDAIANTVGREFLLRVSYLEIYNERVNDLLNKGGTDLKLKEDGSGQVIIKCKEEITNCPENVLAIMKKGDKNRRIGETNMNERSSRSHTIFRITIESREAAGDSDGAIQVSQLNLVDLAGSERARQTGATGERFKEGRHINMSLSTLGLVIMQLSESQDGQKHVNFRDSKLTRLLQSSLGGNAMTAIICAITPAALEETQCTLSFASRAKSVKNKPQVNEVMSDAALLKRYAKQLAKLQEELKKVKNENWSAEMEEMESKLQEKDRINQLLEERIELLKTRIVSGDITNQDEAFKIKSKRRQTWGGPGMFNQNLSLFQPKTGLPTIKEVSFEKPDRKSIMESMDFMHQTFQTAFADFELELFQSERDREDSDSDDEPFITKRNQRVTFKDDVFTIKSRNNSFETTPEKYDTSTQTPSYQFSPSTPKHVLRQRITDLTKEFTELREFTTLEKQVLCRENHCFAREEAQILLGIKNQSQCDVGLNEVEKINTPIAAYDMERISEVKKRLTDLNLADEKDVNRIIVELCVKLNEVEKQNSVEKDEHCKTVEQYSKLEKQIENVTAERNEFEFISRELRAELKKKTVELELKNMSEENMKQPELNKISELEKKIESVISEKNQFERSHVELRAELSKKTTELQKQIEVMTSERNEFEHIRRELYKELNKKSLEIEQLKNGSYIADVQPDQDKIAELEKEIESIKSEKNKFEQINTELESTINSERIEKETAIAKVSELEKQIEELAAEKNQAEHNSAELKTTLNKTIADLESKLLLEQTINQEATNTISELEKQNEIVASKKKELEQINAELNKNISELKSAITVQETEHQQTIENVSELEKQIDTILSEKKNIECINTELRSELDHKISELDTKATLQQNESQKIMEIEEQIENLTLKNTQLECTISELHTALKQKTSELENNKVLQEAENQKSIEKISKLEEQIENLTSKNNEFECITAELRVKLDEEISELNTKMLDETENQKKLEKLSEFESQIANIATEKNEMERIISELRIELDQRTSELEANKVLQEAENQKSVEKISKLEEEIVNITSKHNELECITAELRIKLDEKISELNAKMLDDTENQEKLKQISAYESQITNLTTEKNELERIISELRTKVDQTTSELETNKTLQETEKQETMEKMTELNKKIENMTSVNNELEQVTAELRAALSERTSELNAKITSEELRNREGMEKISEFEIQIANLLSEKKELECVNDELRVKLNKQISKIKKCTTLKECENEELMEMISELEQEIYDITSKKTEFESVNAELQAELAQKTSELELKNESQEKTMEMISELNKQIESVMFERNELDRRNNQLNIELNEKISELQSKILLEQTATKKIVDLEKQIERITSEKRDSDHIEDKDILDSESRSEYDYISENNNLKNCVKNLQDTIMSMKGENQDLRDQLENQSMLSYSKVDESNADISNLIVHIEAEKNELEETLLLKSQELEDIKSDVRELKTDIKKLQDTIYLLTTENMEIATKLTTEQENAKQIELNLQNTIDELYERIALITSEKINLENDLATVKEQLESMRFEIPETRNDEQLFATYQSKIDKLTVENIELSTAIEEKNKELQNIKESKSLLYDHECTYKEKLAILAEKNKCLIAENDELSTDLMDKIEENDMLKEQCNVLKNKTEELLTINANFNENGIEHLKAENNNLKGEIAELKTKVTILSDENAKFSNNLLKTMEELDSSRNEKSYDNTLHMSALFKDTTEIGNDTCEASQDENDETLKNKVTVLQDKIDHLTCLNRKLSDLKLTSCSQCAHLRNLNESRRALKLEAKILNQKLKDLQKKFDLKCQDAKILKQKVNEDLNLSDSNVSLNVSFVNEMDITFVEEKIQSLNDEVKTLKIDHDQLSILYDDKCNELKKLQSDVIVNVTHTNDNATLKKDLNRNENRVCQIQNYIDQLKSDVDEMKKNSTNFNVMFNEFKIEKGNLIHEIDTLKQINEELQQKVRNNESTAINKIQILENDLNSMSKEIEQFSTREKEFESQRLMLEVALENLKAEEENKNALIARLNECISNLNSELDLAKGQKNDLIDSNLIENKEKELECLKKQFEDLQKERMQYNEREQYNASKIKDLEAYINNLQTTIMNKESLFTELQQKAFYFEQLLRENEQEKHILMQKLQAAESGVSDFKNNIETTYKNEFNLISLQYQQRLKESENNLQQLNDTLNKYVGENLKLTQELSALQNIKHKFNELMNEKEQILSSNNMLNSENEKLKEELNDIKTCMIKELKSLKCNINLADISENSINKIFSVFLQTLMSKEAEVIKSISETCEKEKRKLEEEKQQCKDIEKRTTIWAKELEAEIEKLHSEIMEREYAHKEYQNKIAHLEHLLKESTHENEMLKEKIEALETDFNNLQTDFDKQCKIDSQQEEAKFIAQKREKEAQKTFEYKEMELQSKLNAEKDMYEKKIKELVYSIETYKTKNLELTSNIEGLEANEKQLKNIIEIKSNEVKRSNQNVDKMNAELEQYTLAYNKLNQEMDEKNSHIEEITAILKSKCDTLSEYKTQLETIIPEYEMLKEHVKDQTTTIQRHKEEIETIRKEREEELVIIKDKLNSEEIKSSGLSKQLNELNNKNISLIEELNDLKERYEELQEANAKLERKIRNSTSKIKAEAEIEELKELNKRLQNNLEGASNRVVELQEAKSQTLKEFVELKGKYELTLQENAEMKTTLSLYKSKFSTSSSMIDENKYDALLLEKNKIALELEGNKLILNRKNEELKQSASQIKELTRENKELDTELDEYAATIRERDAEISKLEIKLYEVEQKLESISEEKKKLEEQSEAFKTLQTNLEGTNTRTVVFEEEKNKLMKELEAQKLLLNQKDKELKVYVHNIQELTIRNKELSNELNKYSSTSLRTSENSIVNTLKEKLEMAQMENKKLKKDIGELELKLGTGSYNRGITLRKENTKQKLQLTHDKSLAEQEDKYQQLRDKIRELELQIVSKNGKIATLEIQIQSENFPYQRKCKELEELVLAFRTKNAALSAEIRKLQKTVNEDNAWDCEVCRRWRVNRKDQACQTIPNTTIRFCSSNSGVVEEHVKMEKLLREKNLMKELCRSRLRQIRELEDRIKELEDPHASKTN